MNLGPKAGAPVLRSSLCGGWKLHALQTLARQAGAPEYREAFGVRPACRRFPWFMVPMRDQKVVEATHEPARERLARSTSFAGRFSEFERAFGSVAAVIGTVALRCKPAPDHSRIQAE